MKKKDLKNLRGKDKKELLKMADEKRKEAVKVYAEMRAGQEDNLKKYKNIRKDLAQVLTVLKEMEIIESLSEEEGEKKTK